MITIWRMFIKMEMQKKKENSVKFPLGRNQLRGFLKATKEFHQFLGNNEFFLLDLKELLNNIRKQCLKKFEFI